MRFEDNLPRVNWEKSRELSSTTKTDLQESLILEKMEEVMQAFKDEWPDSPVASLSSAEYFRRLGWSIPVDFHPRLPKKDNS